MCLIFALSIKMYAGRQQKAQQLPETDMLLKAMKDLLHKLDEEEKKADALTKREESVGGNE